MASSAAQSITPLYSAETIASRVDELANEIAALRLDDLVIIAVLKGSFIFAADLIRALQRKGLQPEIDFMFLASYGSGTTSVGEVKVPRDANIVPDFTGFRCKPVFVVGYGMDLAHRYRELPFIGEVPPP